MYVCCYQHIVLNIIYSSAIDDDAIPMHAKGKLILTHVRISPLAEQLMVNSSIKHV